MPLNGFSASDFGKLASQSSHYLSSVEQVDGYPWLLPHASYLKQAWQDLELAGVLCVDQRPTVYVCEKTGFSADKVRELQKYTWNQGVAPLLVLISSREIQLHSTLKRPEKPAGPEELIPKTQTPPSLIEAIQASAEAVEHAKRVRSIETGQYFQDHAAFFPASEAVDASLVANLLHAAKKLDAVAAPGWKKVHSHALLGRVLFVKFLEARGFIKPHHFPENHSLEKILAIRPLEEARRLLYQEFFGRMKEEFNGTMFDEALSREEKLLRRGHLDVLADFLSVTDMRDGQKTLGFWAYDFRCIPVEVISSIYEEFMKGQDSAKKRREGAIYTPRHLTETTLHIALEGRYNTSASWRVLDPACGSGIFLGAMFNLLATQWLRQNPRAHRATKVNELLEILQGQIRGVDVNYEACRIAAFSLYLALFEKLRPMDLDEFKEKIRKDKFLPSLVWQRDTPDNPERPVILCGDFLKDELPLERDFDLMIGNPPWTGRAEKQLALHFTRLAPSYLKKNGVACLLLPSTILVNSHGALDHAFFSSVKVEKIVQLADFRKVLFQATHPCFVLRFANTKPEPACKILYETPKLNRFDRRSGCIVVEPDEQKTVRGTELVQAAQQGGFQAIWSRKFWGTPRDEAFLRRLDAYPSLGDSKSAMQWGGAVGFKPYYPGISRDKPKPLAPDWSHADPYLANDSHFPELVVHHDNLTTLGACLKASFVTKTSQEDAKEQAKKTFAATDAVQYKPSAKVFRGPMVVFSNGFTKFAFSKKRILFEDSLRSITGRSSEDAALLRFLTAILGSPLMAYYAFHCGANNGVGRDKLHYKETMALPFPLPGDELAVGNADAIVQEADAIIQRLEKKVSSLSRDERQAEVLAVRAELNSLVEAYYGVTAEERVLIEDTLTLWEPSIHKTNLDCDIPALAFPELPQRRAYAETLTGELSIFRRRKNIHISAETKVSTQLNLMVVTLLFGARRSNYQEVEGDAAFWSALNAMDDAAVRENGNMHYLRGFSYFEDDRVHILKPATMRNWSRTTALNDADAIFELQIQNRA